MANWIREYRFSAGQAGSAGFGINELHINFSVEKSDVSSPNTAKGLRDRAMATVEEALKAAEK